MFKSVHPKLDAETLRVIKQIPKWYPGKTLGEATRVRYNIPVTFRLDDDKANSKK